MHDGRKKAYEGGMKNELCVYFDFSNNRRQRIHRGEDSPRWVCDVSSFHRRADFRKPCSVWLRQKGAKLRKAENPKCKLEYYYSPAGYTIFIVNEPVKIVFFTIFSHQHNFDKPTIHHSSTS